MINNDRMYRTIDHKISIYYGYMNKIDADIISSIENLCITKRFINSKKSAKTENEFLTDLELDGHKTLFS